MTNGSTVVEDVVWCVVVCCVVCDSVLWCGALRCGAMCDVSCVGPHFDAVFRCPLGVGRAGGDLDTPWEGRRDLFVFQWDLQPKISEFNGSSSVAAGN